MNDLMLSTDAATLSPIALFLQADAVVKGVIVALVLASLWSWTIIIGKSLTIGRAAKASEAFEREFAKVEDVDAFARQHQGSRIISIRIFMSGLSEWRLSTNVKVVDKEGTRARLMTAMSSTIAEEADHLSDGLDALATIGSVAPFVGLFGTVWGIMRSFSGIAAAQNTSLAVVAPGIAEALFATALGLFAAIPAVIAYNRFGHRIERIEARLGRFADSFYLTLSRELDAL